MVTLRPPNWTEPMGTGLWGLGYRVREGRGLVLLSNETTLPSDDTDRLWPFILTLDRRRNRLVEQTVAEQEGIGPALEHRALGKDDLLCVRERHLDKPMSFLEKQPS